MSGWGERRHEVMCELNLLFSFLSAVALALVGPLEREGSIEFDAAFLAETEPAG